MLNREYSDVFLAQRQFLLSGISHVDYVFSN
jgi:hypothetical protein